MCDKEVIFKRDFPLAAAAYAPGCVYGSVSNNGLAKGIVCICVIMFAFNFVGDGLRDALDPKLKK